jgi:hypothetical protein
VRARAERPSDEGSRRVSRFIAAHQSCAGEFELARQGGDSGSTIQLICRGCGARRECDPSHPGLLALEAESGKTPRDRAAPGSGIEKWLPSPPALPWWVPNAYIAGVIVVGFALVAFGVVAPRGDDGVGAGVPTPVGQTVETPPPVTPPPVTATASGVGTGAGEASAPERRWEFPAEAKRRRAALRRVEVLNRFAIGVPPGWGGGASGGSVVFVAPGGAAEVRVFLERDRGADLRELVRDARRFLLSRHPGSKVGPSRAASVGGHPAAVLVAGGHGIRERAVLLSAGGFSYLLLQRVTDAAPRVVRFEALAALDSFRAL